MRICVYGASSPFINEKYIAEGEELGRELAKRNHVLVFGAGANGMMGASARGVFAEKGELIGIAPKFFSADGILFENCTKLIRSETMYERKHLLREYADAFIITVGGIGTMDEFFEILTLKQLGRMKTQIVIFNSQGYYDGLSQMLDGFIKEKALYDTVKNLYYVTKDIKDCIDYLENYQIDRIDPKSFKYLD